MGGGETALGDYSVDIDRSNPLQPIRIVQLQLGERGEVGFLT